MRILVVEDDLEAQRYLVNGLKEAGHVVDDAADGELGLTLALSRPYDVAIIDLGPTIKISGDSPEPMIGQNIKHLAAAHGTHIERVDQSNKPQLLILAFKS